MSKTYKVSWAAVARNDLKQIIEYIAIDSPGNASRILKKIKNKTSDLFSSPERGRVVPELKEQGIQDVAEEVVSYTLSQCGSCKPVDQSIEEEKNQDE